MAEPCGAVKAKQEHPGRKHVTMPAEPIQRTRQMTRILMTLFVLGLAGTALAQGRPQSPSLSCAANRQSVIANGAIVLGTGGYTYDRFVVHRGFCQFDEYADPAWVPARDTPQCFVGYRCKSNRPWDD